MRNSLLKYLLSSFPVWGISQGILNNGAQIVFSGAGQIYIAGGSSGDYLSQNGGVIAPSAAGIINMEGDWTNNSVNTGFSLDAGTVIFNGANQSINGTNSTTFYNLTLTGSGTKSQNLNTFVGGVSTTNGVLSLGTRPFDLNSFTLTMTNPVAGGITFSSGYVISETNMAANPSVLRWNMGANTGSHIYPFGTTGGTQIPLTFNKTSAGAADISICTRPTAAADNLPWSSPVTQMFSAMINGDGSVPVVIDRWWDIFGNGAASADVTFSYLGSENTLSAPFNTGFLGAQNWNNTWAPPIGSNLAVLAGVGTAFAPGIAVLANTPGQTPWVLSSLNAPLPIELTNFSANCAGEDELVLNWKTASEKNADRFEIENSFDGYSFRVIGTVKANGTQGAHNYEFVVNGKNSLGNYYRLKMIDNDKTFDYSESIFVTDDCMESQVPQVYYNEMSGIVIKGNSKEASAYTCEIIDAAGRLVRKDLFQFQKGYNHFSYELSVEEGMYLVVVKNNSGISASKKILVLN